MEFKKLVKPLMLTNGDYDLQDVIESLALFYNPSIMNICKERLLSNTDISSVLNACIKTGNMSFLKAYSSILHNRLVGYGYLPKKDNNTVYASSSTLQDVASIYNTQTSEYLDVQYAKLIHMFVSEAGRNGDNIITRLNAIFGIMYKDIMAGVIYDSMNAYITIINEDADDKLTELENIVSGNIDDEFSDEWYMDRLAKLYTEFEGNATLIYDISVNNNPSECNLDLSEATPVGFLHLMEMFKSISSGSVDIELMVNSIEKCAIHLDCSSGYIVGTPPHDYMHDLRKCIRNVRAWLAKAIAVKNKWRSIMSETARFNHVILTKNVVAHVDVNVTAHVHEYLVGVYTDILSFIPTVYGNISNKSKLDILKVIADAIDASIHNVVRSVDLGCMAVEGVYTEDYLRGWSLENYRALHDVTVKVTDDDSWLSTYENTRPYKNPWER